MRPARARHRTGSQRHGLFHYSFREVFAKATGHDVNFGSELVAQLAFQSSQREQSRSWRNVGLQVDIGLRGIDAAGSTPEDAEVRSPASGGQSDYLAAMLPSLWPTA
nr:hypothetical protein [Cryobacterium sp. Hh38]